ncbi:MAG: short-chain dehydrogenase [Geobacter sp.]|nr:MAG: short-chain dehydrogenase [Geobacter sp.]
MPTGNVRKVALVTGGGQGIGKGIARRLVEEGTVVVIADIDGEAAGETAAELGASCSGVAADVADEHAVAGVMKLVLTRFGRLDALINNAGIAAPHAAPVELLELSDWNRVISTNLTGVFLCSKHAVPLLRTSKGAIVNIASTRALQSEPHTEAYAASKGGIVALTHALAVSLGPDIRVNCVSPGWIAVDDWQKSSRRKPPALGPADHAQHPVGRVGCPDDIAAMVSYLISPQAGFVTGQNFVVDGGMTRKMIYAG